MAVSVAGLSGLPFSAVVVESWCALENHLEVLRNIRVAARLKVVPTSDCPLHQRASISDNNSPSAMLALPVGEPFQPAKKLSDEKLAREHGARCAAVRAKDTAVRTPEENDWVEIDKKLFPEIWRIKHRQEER